MMPVGDTKPKPRNQAITELMKNSTVNAEDDMTHDRTSIHMVKEQGGMLVIARAASNSVPKAHDSVSFE